MGERLSGDGVPVRHRHVHPGGTVSDPWDTHDSAALETVLAAAIRAEHLDPEAEQRALAAFRAAAHGDGARRARTRRRDDWRLPEERRVRLPLRMTFGAVFASLALGGVAVAAIGSVGSSHDGGGADRGTTRPSALAPDRPGGAASSASPGRSGPKDRPSPAKDTEAHCRAYEQVDKHGKALDSTAWQRLVTAAGGKDKVAAYCAEQLARAKATPNGRAGTGKPGKDAENSGGGTAGNTGGSGNGTPGAAPSRTHNATGSGRTGDGKGGGKHH
ncbi:hypothetical protein J2Z21_005971 [Streptomyces griseochromogenes]|uniref:Uncharacterized protein n=1 Tax=Streptomyces griseochromogenes TaxID=68214 RepID=A0A1B1AP87_9ACTN|nr:hypothetical protein [Streptomyces griseochromogenes]ANP48366.1 hypothetical protein AVL59_01185 [Streptomyces griseochromogenes]MBP2052982.1 hypothetical protein [Streptomyces griseochromogenes]